MKACKRCGNELAPKRQGNYCSRRRCMSGRDRSLDLNVTVDPADFASVIGGQPVPADNLERLVELTRRAPMEFEQLCDRLGLPPGQVRKLLEAARAQHLAIKLEGGVVGLHASPAAEVQETGLAPVVGRRQMIAHITDTHLGSKYCMRAQLRDFIEYAYAQGVREVLHSGDALDGDYRHGKFELSHMGLDEQTRDLFEVLPALPGLTYHLISGNHEQTFTAASGVDVPKFIAHYFHMNGRNDLFAYGNRGAMLRVRGVLVDMWHPGGGVGYSISYPMQKKIESYPPGGKPQILLIGHWHRFCFIEERGVYAVAGGTFQNGRSEFAKSLKSGPPAIGGSIISWDLTAQGTIRDLILERRSYYDKEVPQAIREAV